MPLWLIPALPLAGFVVLLAIGGRLGWKSVAAIGAGSVGASALAATYVSVPFLLDPQPSGAVVEMLWRWMAVDGFTPAVALRLDALSLVMTLVITWVGFLIHLYATEYMQGDESYARFFASMNLFVFSMLMLVLADDLLLLMLGWEGVGLCSYLLIGFWYKDPANGRAARKAFVVTRIGDTALTIGLFVLFWDLGTLEIQPALALAAERWPVGSGIAIAVAALLLGGAVGKSAQIPLQTWLPDAMAGPTPVSALIHAATMVTAGMYLIARTHTVFTLAPPVMTAVAVVGLATVLLGATAALAQRDIKRVLAYSTISQIGYMFLALGVGAFSAAVFHFMTHAFFKALLFLGAGAVILALHHEQDIYAMGGLKRRLPIVFWTFLAGSAALAGFPLVTSGFYSKDLILWQALAGPGGSIWLWAGGLLAAFLTAVYIFKVVFVVFYGRPKRHIEHEPGWRVYVPLVLLAALSIGGGFVEMPHTLGHWPAFSGFLEPTLPALPEVHDAALPEALTQVLAAVASLAGIGLAWMLFGRRRESGEAAEPATGPEAGGALHRLLESGWGFDWVYDRLLVRPFVWLAEVNRADAVDLVFTGLARGATEVHLALVPTQTGKVRWYAAGIAAGAVLLIAVAVLS